MLIDIGVNLTSKRFAKDLAEVIQRAHTAGIKKLIVTGTNVNESEKAAEMISEYPDCLYSTAGIHPHNAREFTADSIKQLSHLIENKQVIAIGECGLDFNRNFSDPEDQLKCFEAQLELAAETKMPIFLHQRDAHDEFIKILSAYIDDIPAAVAHCFTGSENELSEYLEMGLYVGITGWVCDEERGYELRSLIRQIPLDKLMIETDAPYLLPKDLKPKPKSNRNEPMYLPHICQAVADCYQLPYSVIEKSSYDNSVRFFRLAD